MKAFDNLIVKAVLDLLLQPLQLAEKSLLVSMIVSVNLCVDIDAHHPDGIGEVWVFGLFLGHLEITIGLMVITLKMSDIGGGISPQRLVGGQVALQHAVTQPPQNAKIG